jgi:hypothetical protein
MDRFRSWIDLERLRALVEETAWRPSPPSVLSRRRTETPIEQPRTQPTDGRFEERRRRRWTGVIDDGVPSQDGWADAELSGYPGDHVEPRGPARGGLRVEPPPQPRVPEPQARLDTATQPRLERRSARPNRSVEPPPEPRVPTQSPVPPPPSFGPVVQYEPPRGRSLEDRLAHLLDWATDVSGSDVAFVADHEGLLLARRHACDVEEAVAAVLEGFLEQLGPFLGDAVEGHVTLRSHGRVFVVTWHETDVGRFFLGIVGVRPPPPSVVPELASALASTVADVGELARFDVTLPRSPTPAPVDPPPLPSPSPGSVQATAPVQPHAGAAPTMGLPAPLAEAADDSDAIRFDAPPPPAVEAPPEPTPPPEVALTRASILADAIAAASDPGLVRLRLSLQTGLSADALAELDALTDAELDAVSTSLHRMLGIEVSA